MSAMYSLFPLAEEMKSWLDEQSIAYPLNTESRNPLLTEIQSAIAQLEDYKVEETPIEVGKHWQAFIQNKDDPEHKGWAILNIICLTDGPNEMYFEKGWPDLIVKITVLLSRHTGPVVLICDAGDPPLVVTADADPDVLFQSWGMSP